MECDRELNTWGEEDLEGLVGQNVDRTEVSAEAVEDSAGFVVDLDDLPYSPTPANLLAPSNSNAPTMLEIEMFKAQEVRKLRENRKYKDSAKTTKGAPSVGSYSEQDQSYMAIMRAHIFFDFVSRSPWSEDEGPLIERAKAFTDKYTDWSGDSVVTEQFLKTVSRSFTIWVLHLLMIHSFLDL